MLSTRQQIIKCETPDAIYELSLTISEKPVVSDAEKKLDALCDALADKFLNRYGSVEDALDAVSHMGLALSLGKRMGKF